MNETLAPLRAALYERSTIHPDQVCCSSMIVARDKCAGRSLHSCRDVKIVSSSPLLPSSQFGPVVLQTAIRSLETPLVAALLVARNNGLLHSDDVLSGAEMNDVQTQAFAQALRNNRNVLALNLSRNKIQTAGALALADALQFNSVLQSLNMHHNHLGDSGVSALCGALCVSHSLGARRLSIEASPPVSTLTSIDLASTHCGNAGVLQLAMAIQSQTSCLCVVNVSANHIGDEGAASLASALAVSKTLRVMHLGTNQIGDAGCAKIADALVANRSLHELTLSANPIGPKGAAKLFEALRQNSTLRTLALAGVRVRPEAAAVLAWALVANAQTQLCDVDLGQCELGIAGVEVLAMALRRNTSLTNIRAPDNGVPHATLVAREYFGNPFQVCGASHFIAAILLRVWLIRNKQTKLICNSSPCVQRDRVRSSAAVIGHDGLPVAYNKTKIIEHLADQQHEFIVDQLRASPDGELSFLRGLNLCAATQFFAPLRHNTTITKIDLTQCHLGDIGAVELCKALRFNIALQTVILNKNQIDTSGATAVADMLRYNTTLLHLHLVQNRCGNEGVAAIGAALRQNATLHSLVLDENNCRDAGAVALIDALALNVSLRSLSVSESLVGNESVAAVARLVAANTGLRELKFVGRAIDPKQCADALVEAMRVNTRLVSVLPFAGQIREIDAFCVRNKSGTAIEATASTSTTVALHDVAVSFLPPRMAVE